MRLLIMGAPGAGKGTQAHSIAERYGIPAISTGSIFRRSVSLGTPLGLKIESLLARGEFVPDTMTEHVVAERLSEPDVANGWLLDGYPRTVHQVMALDMYLAGKGQQLDAVISLQVPIDALVARLFQRARLEGRSDDNCDTISRRMQNYVVETQPLMDIYRDRGLLVEVDGVGRVNEVSDRIIRAVDECVGSR